MTARRLIPNPLSTPHPPEELQEKCFTVFVFQEYCWLVRQLHCIHSGTLAAAANVLPVFTALVQWDSTDREKYIFI